MALKLCTEIRNNESYTIVDSNNLYISPQAWIDFNLQYSKEEIKEAISSAIDEYHIQLPTEDIQLEVAKEDFAKLTKLDSTSLLQRGELFTRYDYKYELSNLYVDSCNIGNKSSNYYHQESRYLCDSINSPSPYRSWHIKKFRDTLLNCLWSLKFEQIDFKILKSALHLRKYVASQFRPSAAKCVYQYFNSKDVLDFSSGWGDRLNGFLSCENTKSYLGIDPNTRLSIGYQNQLYSYNNSNKNVIMKMECAEDADIPINQFDTVFTSPPYFNVERYNQEESQSWKRYKKLHNWLDGFLFPVLQKSWDSLKSNGNMIINISDVYSNHTINKICDPMNDFISKLNGADYQGTIGLRMAKRPNSKAVKGNGIFVEPMWLWKKI